MYMRNQFMSDRGAHGRLLQALLVGTAVAAIGAVPAAAQDAAPADGETQATPASSSGVIIVTARKREERLVDVPAAVSALNTAEIDRFGAADINSIVQRLPQVDILTAVSGSGAVVSIRGVGSSASDSSIEQAVTFNIDGVPISRGRIVEAAFFDQQSIQVLKGPQALYFGKNSPAGVIAIDSVSPGNETEGYVRAGYALKARQAYGEFAISHPLSEDLSARIALRMSDMDRGYIKGRAGPVTDPTRLPLGLALRDLTLPGSPSDYYPQIREKTGRFTLRYSSDSPVDATFKFLISENKNNGDSTNAVINSCNPAIGAPATIDFATQGLLVDPTGSCSIEDRVSNVGAIPQEYANALTGGSSEYYGDTLTKLSSLTINIDAADWLTLTSVSGYYDYNHKSFSPYDWTVFAVAPVFAEDDNRSFSQELRAVTDFDGPLNVSLGAFYQNDRRNFFTSLSLLYLPPVPGLDSNDLSRTSQTFKGKTYSAFGELNFKLSDTIELAGGARYTKEDKSANVSQDYLFPALAGLALPAGQSLVDDFTLDNWSPQATLSWKPSDDSLLYAAYKKGFKSGGFSSVGLIPATATVDNQRFRSETVEGFELGYKFSNLLPGLRGDLTLYNYKYNDLQLTAFDAESTAFFTVNAAAARVKGAEFNFDYQASDAFGLHGSVAYNKARFLDFPGAQCWSGQPTSADGVTPTNPADPLLSVANGQFCVNGVQDLTGFRLPKASDWTLIGGFNWDQELGSSGWSFGLTGEAKYLSDYSAAPNLNPLLDQPGFVTLNANVRLSNYDWEVAVIAQNLTDKDYRVTGTDTVLQAGGQTAAVLGTPREVKVQVTRRF